MADERDREIEQLQRQLRWAQQDNKRLWDWLDIALVQLREANERAKSCAEARVADAHARTLDAEARLAAATLAGREPDAKLH
jgi:hypothetical protein